VHSLGFEAQALVERDCIEISFPDGQLDAGKAEREGCIDRPSHQPATNAFAAKPR